MKFEADVVNWTASPKEKLSEKKAPVNCPLSYNARPNRARFPLSRRHATFLFFLFFLSMYYYYSTKCAKTDEPP